MRPFERDAILIIKGWTGLKQKKNMGNVARKEGGGLKKNSQGVTGQRKLLRLCREGAG